MTAANKINNIYHLHSTEIFIKYKKKSTNNKIKDSGSWDFIS